MNKTFNRCVFWFWVMLSTAVISINSLATEVYITRDKDGNPIFSDQPSSNAEKIIIEDIQTVPIEPVTPITSPFAEVKELPRYSDFSIVSPKEDEAVRENTGGVAVLITLDPELRGNDSVALYLDGSEVASGRQLTFNLENVDRGTHTLQAKILSSNGKSVFESNSITFHLLRFSIQNPPSR